MNINRIRRILKNPQKKKELYKFIVHNAVSLILLILLIFDLSLRNIKVDENNTHKITGVVSQVYKPYNIPNSTPIIVVTIGNIEYKLIVRDLYRVSDLINEIKVGTKVTAKITKYKTLMPINKLRGENIIVDLRTDPKIYYDIELDNKDRKTSIIGTTLIFSVLWIIVFSLSFLYIKFIL